MFDPITTAEVVSRWTDLGVTIPAKLRTAIEVFDASGFVDEPYTEVDPAKVTAANVEKTVSDLADLLAAKAVWFDARSRVQNVLAAQVLNLAGEAVEGILKGLQPGFGKAAARFADLVESLPQDLTAASLVQSGPVALQTYQDAVAVQAELLTADQFLSTLIHLPRFGGHSPDPAVRLFAPETRAQLQTLTDAQGQYNVEKYGELSPLLIEGVRAGIAFALNAPDRAAEIRAGIEAQHVERKQLQFLRFN